MKEAEAVLAVAHLQPVTIDEIVAAWPDDVKRTAVTGAIRNCYQHGILVRRRRHDDKLGMEPYEYGLAELADPDASEVNRDE